MDAMDPYCGWNELKEQCSPAPEKNPLIAYWHQNVNSCPKFTHPGEYSQSAICNYVLCSFRMRVLRRVLNFSFCSTGRMVGMVDVVSVQPSQFEQRSVRSMHVL